MTNNLDGFFDDLFGDGHDQPMDDVPGDQTNSSNERDGDNVDQTNSNIEGDGDNADGHPATDGDDEINLGPQVGIEYESREILLTAYNSYAKVKVFSTSIRSSSSKYVTVGCAKGRKPNAKKFTKQTGCLAHINANVQSSGFWKVNGVYPDHNHDLQPELAMFMPSHRHLTLNMQHLLVKHDRAGISVAKNVRIMESMAGGPQNLGVTDRDCRNFIDKRRRLNLGIGDAEAINQLFMKMQVADRNFIHLIDVDDEGRLRNVMWIHPRSKVAYEDFHDVITFDTTYLVNRYQMPLATVVGINQHYQSILLGCCLLSHEDKASFVWFFTNWLQAMGGVQPNAMLTDQCESIRNAAKEVFPDTIHRLCFWHIATKMSLKFKGVANYKRCSDDFYSMVYDSVTIGEFETMWTEFQNKYSLQNNRWLTSLFEERQNWAPIYLNHMFWAGMVSTQRSESMHAFFDGYINSRSTLMRFVEQYEVAIHNKLHKEMHADFQSKWVILQCQSSFAWEKQLLGVYTHNVSRILQQEIKKISNCNVEEVVELGDDDVVGVEKYRVLEMRLLSNNVHKKVTYTVTYRPVGEYISCDCRKFEFKGMLCVHMLKFLVFKDIRSINERYIIRRWRKDVYRPHSSVVFAGAYPHMTANDKKFEEMERIFLQCSDAAFDHSEKIDLLKARLLEVLAEVNSFIPSTPSTLNDAEEYEGPWNNGSVLRNPRVTRSRGRPRVNRIRSSRETNSGGASGGGGGASGGDGGGRGGGASGGDGGGRGGGASGRDRGNNRRGRATQ